MSLHIRSTKLAYQLVLNKFCHLRHQETNPNTTPYCLRQNIESRIQHQNADVHLCLAPYSVEHTREPAYKRTIVHYAYVSTSVPCSSPHVLLLKFLQGIEFVTWLNSSKFPPWIWCWSTNHTNWMNQNLALWFAGHYQICGGNIKLIGHTTILAICKGSRFALLRTQWKTLHLLLKIIVIYKYAGGGRRI